MKRGEVWWVSFPRPMGRRPAVLVSRDQAYGVRERVTVIPVTRTGRGLPTEITLGPGDGLPKHCVANADDVMTKGAASHYVCALNAEKVQALDQAIKFALDLP